MSWQLAHIGDCVEKVTSWNPMKSEDEAPFLYIDLSSVDKDKKELVRNAISKVLPSDAPSRARQLVKSGDVLVATVRPNLNGVAIVSEQYDGATASTGYCVLRPEGNSLDSKYLYYWVQSQAFISDMMRKATGANYPAVSDKIVKESIIPLPPLETQKQIAAILEKADQLRKDCQQMEQELNNLAQSVFMDMFGKHLESGQFVNLGEVADVVSGVTKGQKLEGKKTQMVPYMRVANVQAGYLDLSEIKDIEVKLSDVDKYRLECGDMLLTEGGDFDKLGRGALWEGKIENCIHQNHVFRVRLDRDKYLPEWFNGFLQTDFAKRYFLKCAKKTTNLASINITQLKGLPMPTVGVDLQNSFFDKIKIIKEKRELASKAFCEHDQTFNSLMQKAFNGELNIKTKAA